MASAPPLSVVNAAIKKGSPLGMPIAGKVAARVQRVVVDTHLHLPDMFEIEIADNDGTAADDAGLEIGTAIEILGMKAGATSGTSLIKGEITSIEAICVDNQITTVLRGYEKAHRLQRARHSRTFLKMKDSEIARQVATKAGLQIGDIDTSDTKHEHLAQVAQTDWEFLLERAREIGFETGVTGGKFFFRKASGLPAGGIGGAVSAAAGAVAGALGIGGGLTFRQNLISFLPRISAANITPSVEVRVWDPKTARVAVGTSDAKTGTAKMKNEDPIALAKTFTSGMIPSLPSPPALPAIPGLPKLDFGSTPGDNSFVVVDRPLATGSAADGAATEAAKGLADAISSTFAEAEGEAYGDPDIQAGEQVDIKGVPKAFIGKWTVTNAKHIFDASAGGYRTKFFVSGRSNRSLAALAAGASTAKSSPQLSGLVCGVVTNVKDPDKQGKVKVALPWLSPSFESDWARVVQITAGPRTGAMFLPEVGDEVLVGFEFGDARRPYVIGGLLNDNAKYKLGGPPVNGSGVVTWRGLASPAGNVLSFNDDLPPGPPGPPPTTSAIMLGTGDGNLALKIDQVAGTVLLSCKPAPPKSKTAAGTLTIDCSGAGKIEIKGGAGGVKIDSDGMLELHGKLGVKVASDAMVEVQGKMIKLN